MTNLIVEVSKYLMILLMAVYTYANFRYFSLKDVGRKQRVCGGQNRAMFAIHFLAYVVMYLKTGNEGVKLMLIAFYAAQVVFFLCYIYLYRFLYRNVSRLLVNNTCMLLCVGFIMLTRLSLDKGLDKAVRQYIIVVISACLAWSYLILWNGCGSFISFSGCTRDWGSWSSSSCMLLEMKASAHSCP